jgi:hypothetical protein
LRLCAALSLLVRRLLEGQRERGRGLGLVAALLLTSPYAHLQREQFVLMSILPISRWRRGGRGKEVGRSRAGAGAGCWPRPGCAEAPFPDLPGC